MLPSTSPREALLACPPSSFMVESTLISSCSRSDLPLSRQGVALAHFDSLPLMIWYSGLTALFLFLLVKAAPAYLPTALSVAPRPLFPFQQSQHVEVFLPKPAPFCMLFAGLGSTNKPAISLLLLSDSRSILATLSSPPSFLLPETLWQIWQELFSLSCCSMRLQWVPGHSFLPGKDAANELARRGVLLVPSAIPCSLSPLISRIHSCLLSDWRRTVSSKFFDPQVPSISTEEFVLSVMLAVFFLVYAAVDTAFCLVLISLGLAESRILPAVPVDTRPMTPLISFCTVQLRTLCAAHSLATLCLFTTSGPDPGELPGF